jgi:enamine deaminase RidA (YjgF/YER057c/UK114 family)
VVEGGIMRCKPHAVNGFPAAPSRWHHARPREGTATMTADITHLLPPEPARMPPLSLAVRTGDLLFVSGVGPHDPEWKIATGDFTAQMAQVLRTLEIVLESAGTNRAHIVKTTVLLTREGDIPEMNRLYAAWFGGPPFPARTTAVVRALPVKDFLLEIECVAAMPKAG